MKFSRTVVLVWVTLWMLALPLFHIHPESDHHHGDPGHVHGGMVHTVFSNDLPCEYATHYGGTLNLVNQASHALDHPEINFLLASSVDRQGGKSATDAFSNEGPWEPFLSASSSAPLLLIDPPQFLLLSAGLSSRAPPERST